MPTTITSYFSFVGAETALSAQVNTNYGNHRGDLLPVETNTATASDLTHHLGSTTHRWNQGYINTFYFANVTNAGLGIRGDDSGTGIDILSGATITAKFETSGIDFIYEKARGSTNTSSSDGNFLVPSSSGDFFIGNTIVAVTHFTISAWNGTLNLVKGGPVRIVLNSVNNTNLAGVINVSADIAPNLVLHRDGTTIGSVFLQSRAGSSGDQVYVMPCSHVEFMDVYPTIASVTYSFSIRTDLPTTTSLVRVRYCKPIIYEL